MSVELPKLESHIDTFRKSPLYKSMLAIDSSLGHLKIYISNIDEKKIEILETQLYFTALHNLISTCRIKIENLQQQIEKEEISTEIAQSALEVIFEEIDNTIETIKQNIDKLAVAESREKIIGTAMRYLSKQQEKEPKLIKDFIAAIEAPENTDIDYTYNEILTKFKAAPKSHQSPLWAEITCILEVYIGEAENNWGAAIKIRKATEQWEQKRSQLKKQLIPDIASPKPVASAESLHNSIHAPQPKPLTAPQLAPASSTRETPTPPPTISQAPKAQRTSIRKILGFSRPLAAAGIIALFSSFFQNHPHTSVKSTHTPATAQTPAVNTTTHLQTPQLPIPAKTTALATTNTSRSLSQYITSNKHASAEYAARQMLTTAGLQNLPVSTATLANWWFSKRTNSPLNLARRNAAQHGIDTHTHRGDTYSLDITSNGDINFHHTRNNRELYTVHIDSHHYDQGRVAANQEAQNTRQRSVHVSMEAGHILHAQYAPTMPQNTPIASTDTTQTAILADLDAINTLCKTATTAPGITASTDILLAQTCITPALYVSDTYDTRYIDPTSDHIHRLDQWFTNQSWQEKQYQEPTAARLASIDQEIMTQRSARNERTTRNSWWQRVKNWFT